MEKYGVDIPQEKTKTAEKAQNGVCRDCGNLLVSTANVPQCPRCGTKPYESKK